MQLVAIMSTADNNVIFACHLCTFKTSSRESLQLHKRKPCLRRVVVSLCDVCLASMSKKFAPGGEDPQATNPLSLEVGKLTPGSPCRFPLSKNPDSEFICGFCDFNSSRKVLIIRNRERQLLRRKTLRCQVQCNQCSFNTDSKRGLIFHKKLEHPRQKITTQCDVCLKSISVANMARHKREVHLKTKSFPCPLCKKPFPYPWRLKRHSQVHLKQGTHALDPKSEFERVVTTLPLTLDAEDETISHLNASLVDLDSRELYNFNVLSEGPQH